MAELTISDDLYDRIESRLSDTEFESVDEYAAFVLAETVTRVEHASTESGESTASREEVRDRLQSLGYLEE